MRGASGLASLEEKIAAAIASVKRDTSDGNVRDVIPDDDNNFDIILSDDESLSPLEVVRPKAMINRGQSVYDAPSNVIAGGQRSFLDDFDDDDDRIARLSNTEGTVRSQRSLSRDSTSSRRSGSVHVSDRLHAHAKTKESV